MAKKKQISKAEANKCASVVSRYAIQEAKKGAKKGAKATGKAAAKVAKSGFAKLKGLFNK